ncbi:MAG: M56 family metallopeptidase, partial [Vicinamibacterales bacterium]
LVLVGWSVLVVLWHTTAVALLLGVWRLWRRARPAQSHYVAAVGALTAAVILTTATPVALMSAPSATKITQTGMAPRTARTLPIESLSSSASSATATPFASTARVNDFVQWIGVAWVVGFVVGVLRLAGGWTVALWIRQRAKPVAAGGILKTAVQVSERWQLPSARLLTSEHVEAPVVIGHRSPAILLPHDAEQRLTAEAISALIAHELAHVARRDYIINLVQSFGDALLFFSPGAWWISRCVRDSREYCCDDVVVEQCGPAPYVNALTTLAALSAVSRGRPAVGAAGPRLIVRIRRLLKEDVMISFVGYRLGALAGVFVGLLLVGGGVVRLSAAGVAQATASSRQPAGFSATNGVPIAYATQQPGAAVALTSVAASTEGLCGTVVVYNSSDMAVTGLRFVAVVTSQGRRLPVFIGSSEWIGVDVPPLGEAPVTVGLMPASEVYSRMNGAPSQVMCALRDVRFANNSSWSMTPNPVATTAEDAVGFIRPEVSRALIGTASTSTEPNTCVDDNGGRYSQGALVSVRLEPGRLARCSGGRWSDYVATPVPAKPSVEIELQWPNGPTPRLKVEPGQMATVRVGISSWGLLATLDAADPSGVHLAIYDLSSQPRQQVANLFATVGAPGISSGTDPAFTMRVVSSSGAK